LYSLDRQGHAGRTALGILAAALLLRFLFWLPYYLPGDVLNYLNAWDIYADRGIGNPMHAVRLGMTLPLTLMRWFRGGLAFWLG